MVSLPRNALLTICKSFIRLHLDYSDIAYDQSTNDLVKNRKVQCNAALVITGAIKGTSRKKLFKDLGLESLKLSRKLRGLCTFYKIKTAGLPTSIFRFMPSTTHSQQTITEWC